MNDSAHRRVWEDLPWLLNGTLPDEQRARVLAHLQHCGDCREEYAFQRRIRDGIAEETVVPEAEVHAGWTRLLARIDDAGDEPRVDAGRSPNVAAAHRGARARRRHRVVVGALLAQSVLLVLFGVATLVRRPEVEPAYRTLSRAATQASGATIRWVPEPGMTVARIRSLLAQARLRVVETNADGSIYGLAPETDASRDATARAIAFLRAQPGVLLVEPIGASGDGAP